jgi:AraC-like DNA-binding protein
LSSLEGESKWITFLVRVFVIVIAIQLLIFIICNIFSLIPFCVVLTGIFFVFSFLIVNSLILLGLSNPNFFSEGRRYGTSSLNPDLIPVYVDQLTHALNEEKVYLDPLMTMEKLAKKLRIPKNHLSQVINQQYKSNYNGMINKYRIDEATRLMVGSRDESTIIGIAYRVGFNSKSTFNTAFKKVAGMTPTEYITNQQGLS